MTNKIDPKVLELTNSPKFRTQLERWEHFRSEGIKTGLAADSMELAEYIAQRMQEWQFIDPDKPSTGGIYCLICVEEGMGNGRLYQDLPHCLNCGQHHSRQITCEECREWMDADRKMGDPNP